MLSLAIYQKSYSAQVVLDIIWTFNRILHLRSIVFPMDGIRTNRLVIDEAFTEADRCNHYPYSRLLAPPLPQHVLMVPR